MSEASGAPWPPTAMSRARTSDTTGTPVRSAIQAGSPSWSVPRACAPSTQWNTVWPCEQMRSTGAARGDGVRGDLRERLSDAGVELGTHRRSAARPGGRVRTRCARSVGRVRARCRSGAAGRAARRRRRRSRRSRHRCRRGTCPRSSPGPSSGLLQGDPQPAVDGQPSARASATSMPRPSIRHGGLDLPVGGAAARPPPPSRSAP